MRRIILTIAVVAVGADVVAAADDRRPPIELGIGISAVMPFEIGDLGGIREVPAADLRVTLPFSPRFSLESVVTMGRKADKWVEQFEGAYTVQVKQRLVRATTRGFHPFVTYGATGYFERGRRHGFTFIQQDGSPATYPGRSFGSVIPPVLATVGAGVQQELGRRIALRVEGQLLTLLWIPLDTRVSASASIPLGRPWRT
jgi:hypothetical protein